MAVRLPPRLAFALAQIVSGTMPDGGPAGFALDHQQLMIAKRSNQMRLSRYFMPVLRENPADAQIVSHRLMLRAGMIKQATAGIYSWLPLGFRVRRKL